MAASDLRSEATGGPQSADGERFDYVEKAESSGGSRSQSTVSDIACWDTPFAHDSLGDTVIHFDRASSYYLLIN